MITNRSFPRIKIRAVHLSVAAASVLQAGAVLVLAQHKGLWPLAVIVIAVTELWTLRPGSRPAGQRRGSVALGKVPDLVLGVSAVLIIALTPRLVTQIAVAALYGAARVWWTSVRLDTTSGLAGLLIIQGAMFEALFLMPAIWRTSSWVVLLCVWLGSYLSVYSVLTRRGERAASVMAATWALITAEVSWVLLLWLFTYTSTGGYILVPQPALILTALAYCFGSIYLAQRQGKLSRGRLTEYLLIGLILITIVIMGTPWRGSI